MDIIRIEKLKVFAYHGVYPEENRAGQTFYVSAEMKADFSEAIREDELEKSTDYSLLCHFITDYMLNNTFRLIETVSVRLAEAVLLAFPLLSGVRIRIDKPEAPIGLPFGNVSVETERSWHSVYIGLGSNMGDREAYLNGAVEKLRDTEGIRIGRISEFITTAPYGGVPQDDFLNGVLEIRTYLSPQELLKRLHEIEAEAGRVREVRWGPRTLDLDILLYDDLILDTEELHIPHIDMHNRDFVLKPLAEIAPYLRHPVLNRTVQELAQ